MSLLGNINLGYDFLQEQLKAAEDAGYDISGYDDQVAKDYLGLSAYDTNLANLQQATSNVQDVNQLVDIGKTLDYQTSPGMFDIAPRDIIANQAIDYNINQGVNLTTPVGEHGDKFVLNDIPDNVNRQAYISGLQDQGYLPDTNYEWNTNVRDDGTVVAEIDYPGDSLFETLFKGAVTTGLTGGTALGIGQVAAPWVAGAAASVPSTAISGGDLEDFAKNAVTGAATSGLLAPHLPGYQIDNFAGAGARGAYNSAIKQIVNGEMDLETILKDAALQTAVEIGMDVFGDARHTNDGNLQEGRDTVNGAPITQADIARLTNTSDAYGLLGENGFLSMLGFDPFYLPTDLLGEGLDLIGMGSRPVVDPDGSIAEKYQKEIDGIHADETLTYEQKNEQIMNAVDGYFLETQRYDERFFDLTTPRGDSPMAGIWEENPYAKQGTPSIPSPGQGSAPAKVTGVQYETQFPEQEFEDIGQTDLPSVEDIPELPPVEEPIPSGEGELVVGGTPPLPTEDPVPPPEEYIPPPPTDDEEEYIPGGGGTGGGGRTGFGMLGFGGDDEWEDFMAGINVNFEMLEKLGVTPTQYLDMMIEDLKEI